MQRILIATLIVAAAVGGVTAVAVVRSGSRSGSNSKGPSGYLGQDSNSVVFLQWTAGSAGALTGSVVGVEVADPNRDPYTLSSVSYSLTGVRSGSQLSLTVHADLGVTRTWSGIFRGSDIALNVPQDNGSIQTYTLHPASTGAYNLAADTLRARVAQQKAAADQAVQQAADEKAAAAQRAEQAAAEAEQRATAATLATYHQTCAQHGGTMTSTPAENVGYGYNGPDSAGQFCVVAYASEGRFAVPIKSDGSYDQSGADENRTHCASDTSNANASASSGYQWKSQPDYHPSSGVCFHGSP